MTERTNEAAVGIENAALPCCNVIEPDGLCGGVTLWGWPTYLCGTCGAQCGALVHPQHTSPPAHPNPEPPTGDGGREGGPS